MGTLAILLAITIIWPFIAKHIFGHELDWVEFFVNLAIGVVIVTLGYYFSIQYQTTDTEILNAKLISKAPERVHCEHAYPCNFRRHCSGSGKHRSCYTTSDICFRHTYDISWYLNSDIGRHVEVDRIDSQGLEEPPRFTSAQMGESMAIRNNFDNYVKAVPHSLFNKAIELNALHQYEGKLPAYPIGVYDVHRLNRVISLMPAGSADSLDLNAWNYDLSELLKTLGPIKKINAVIVFTPDPDPLFATALRAYWLGGKLNDAVIVIGTPDAKEIKWVRVFSWSDSELFKVKLQDSISDMKVIDKEQILATINNDALKYFRNKHSADFEYLKSEIEPELWMSILLGLFGLIVSMIVSYKLANN